MFADCGNDARICVLDSRQSSSAPVIVIEDEASHGCGVGTDRLRTMLLAEPCFRAMLCCQVNSVAWHPSDEHTIASVRQHQPRHKLSICIGCLTAVPCQLA